MVITVVGGVLLFPFNSLFFFFFCFLFSCFDRTVLCATMRAHAPIPSHSVLLRASSQLQTLDVMSERERENSVSRAV